MKPIYAFNDYLFEIWPLDEYARKFLVNSCEDNQVSYTLELTTMGTSSFKFTKDAYFSMKKMLVN